MTKKTAQNEMANANVSVAPLEKDCLMFMCTQYTFDSVFLFAFAVFVFLRFHSLLKQVTTQRALLYANKTWAPIA